MEEREARAKNRQKAYLRRENPDDSRISAHSDINLKRNDHDNKDNRVISDHNVQEKHEDLDLVDEETKNFLEEMRKGTYNILVAVRCRPLSQKEKEISEFEIVKILDKKMVILIDPYEYNGPSDVFKSRSREQQYAFDFAFDKNCSQHNVFNNTTKFLLEGVVNGYNATVFAYGATGAGKTHTMLGTEDKEGIMVLTLQELFDKISFYSSDREYKIKLWYLEIYNENIRDLLCPNNEEYLDLREDPSKGVSVANITELTVTSCKDIMQLLKKGNKNRTTEATNANETSSRSHAILQVLVEFKEKLTGLEAEIKIGKLSLIDLAGSERASANFSRGIRLIEGANINRSLLTLGNCINALCEANEKGTKPYIPYRDSKLTRLLKDSLGGNSRTVMIANVSPSIQTFEDTRNTLAYANRAKNIKTSVQRNVVSVQYHISNYDQIIKNLKTEINELKTQLAKKDFSLNNIVPAKQESMKKPTEELKDPIPKSISNVNSIYFEKAVAELKSHCEEELVLKQKIIDQEQEMNNLNALINKKKIDFVNNSANNIFNSLRLNTNTDMNILSSNGNNNNNINNTNKDLINLNINLNDDLTTNLNLLEEKEILINPNQNNSLISNIPMINPVSNANNEAAAAQQKELEGKMALMRKNWDKNMDKFKEMQKKREGLMLTYNKNGIKDFHYEYLQSIIKAHNLKIFIIENRFKEKFNYIVSEVKENYISVLEGQLKIRDDLIKKQNVALPVDDSEKLKSLDQIKNEFSYKLPLILNHKIVKDPNASLDLNFSSMSGNNLPPINRQNVNSLLSEIKSVNTNISRIENGLRENNNYNYNNNFNANNNPISYKNRLKSEYTANLNRLGGDNLNNKLKYARNYSQGVRNLNMAMLNQNANSSGNLNGNSNPNGSNIINSPNIDNQAKIQRMQQNKLLALANKNLKRSKNFDLNLIGQKQRDAQSEKSDSHNLSREYDSYMLDLDNSKDDSQIRKLKQQIRERKSAQPKSYNIRDDSSSNYSPVRKGIPSQMRKDYDSIPVVKKKDLNVFLVERNKNKVLKKNVFKI